MSAKRPILLASMAVEIYGKFKIIKINFMPPEDLDDETRMEVDEDGLKEELADQLMNGDPDEALQRMDDVGIDVDDLDL